MTEMTQGQIIKGELGATHPAKLIYTILKKKKTGTLAFDDGVTKVRMFFKDGCLVPYVRGIKGDKKFTRYLLNNKKATMDEIKLARKQAKKEKLKTVDVLIEKGILDEFAVKQDAGDFYWKSIPGVFAWRHGTFEFTDQKLSNIDASLEPEKTLHQIIQGVRIHYNQSMIQHRLKKRMKSAPRPYKEATYSIEQLGLSEEEIQFAMALLNGTPIFDALGKVELPHSDAMALAFSLLTLEIIKFKGAKKKKKIIKKSSILDQAMEAAAASVDRIHEKITQEEDEEVAQPVTQAPQPAQPAMDSSGAELQAKLEEMNRIAQGAADGTAAEDSIGDFNFDEELGDFASNETTMEENSDEELIGGDFDLDEMNMDETSMEEPVDFDFSEETTMESDQYGSDDEISLGDLGELGELEDDSETIEPMSDISDMESFQEEPEDFTFNPDETPQDIFKLGLTYEEQGSFGVARRAFEEAINRDYNSSEVQCHLAWAIYNDSKSDEGFENAAAILQAVIKADPLTHFPYLFLGKMYEIEGDHSMAELYYIKALEINRDCEEAKNNIKRLHEER